MNNKIISLNEEKFGFMGWLFLHTNMPLLTSISSKRMALMLFTKAAPIRIGLIFDALTKELKEDKDTVMLALSKATIPDVYHILTLCNTLHEDRDFILLALQRSKTNDIKRIYLSLNKELQDDLEITLIYKAAVFSRQ
ncbi:MAG: hypothetical protein WCH76_00600 [Candidatus Riflemargulisbacteria bacterium]